MIRGELDFPLDVVQREGNYLVHELKLGVNGIAIIVTADRHQSLCSTQEFWIHVVKLPRFDLHIAFEILPLVFAPERWGAQFLLCVENPKSGSFSVNPFRV